MNAFLIHLKSLPRFPIYAYFVAVYPILLLFSHNQKELNLSDLVMPVVIGIFTASCLLLLFKVIYRNWHKAAVLTTVILLIGLSYGYIVQFLRTYLYPYVNLNRYSFGEDKILFSFFALLIVVMALSLWFTRHKMQSMTSILNATFMVALLFPLYTIASIALTSTTTVLKNTEVQAITGATSQKPNIYYFIFDKYGSSAMLQQYYNIDNSSWDQFLHDKGFYVVDNARTNYPKTTFSLGSSLNMDYLQTFKPEVSDDREEVSIVFPLLQHPKVAQVLQSAGYKYIHVSSWFEPTKTSQIADEIVNYDSNRLNLSEFQKMLLNQSALAPVVDQVLPLNEYQQQLQGLQYQFAHMPQVIDKSGPKFVFAHFILPHGPTVFDADCKVLKGSQIVKLSRIEQYAGHVKCANKEATALITQIQKDDPSAIIVFQSDEGPIDYLYGMTDDYDFAIGSHESRMIRSGIQMAFYFPSKDYSHLYQGMTPVNSFRIIFNQFFNQNYTLLPDTTYAMKSRAKLFEFMELTDEVRGKN